MKTKLPAMPKPKTQKESSKPAIRLRHIKLSGKSAFPPAPQAFGPPDANAGPAFDPGASAGAGMGDTGA